MTIKDMFEDFRRECEKIVRLNKTETVVYVSGTKQKRTKFERLIEKYNSDSELDFELGINACRDFEIKAYNVMKRSMEHFQVY